MSATLSRGKGERELVTILVTVEVDHAGLDRATIERKALEHVSYIAIDTSTSGTNHFALVTRARVSKRRSKIRT